MFTKNKRETVRVPAITFATHNFHKMLRVIARNKQFDFADILSGMYQRRVNLLKSMAALLSVSTVLYIAVHTMTTDLSVSAPFIRIELSRIFATFLISVCWFFGILNFVSATVLHSYTMVVEKKLYNHRYLAMFSRVHEFESAWMDPFQLQWEFFKSGKTQSLVRWSALFVVCLPIILIGVMIAYGSLDFIFRTINAGGLSVIELFLSVSSIALFIFPILYFIIIFFPFSVEKNRTYVRWNFLTDIWRSSLRSHPNAGSWILQEDKEGRESSV